MKGLLAVGFGGMIGSLLRAGIYGIMPSTIGLWTVNLFGSLLIGFIAARYSHKSAEFRLFASTGLIGSFTTFSAFSAEWFRLLDREFLLGIVFAVSMTLFSVAAAAIGLMIGRKQDVQ
ncbi:CrcB family protein [Planococcus shenhongbingii]|uniref:fluoride efflux transporter FluC n=1 Tax=Planococcus shenhongbingii TaxID=3058398 RepID=UPI002614F786|nr:CrcB family protein [Planococcus sp. N016]WKA59046.1 CrcB family protein [Planococcus sp. N016]